jgi:TolB-like protein
MDVLLEFGARFGLPPDFDRIALALFLAGFIATALLLGFRAASRRPVLVDAAGVLVITTICATFALGMARWLMPDETRSDLISIAVLPCEYSGEPQYAYLGNGLAEEVHARLARASGIHVPASRSVRKALETTSDRARVAEFLHVQHLTSCRIDQQPGNVLLQAEVVAPATSEVVWTRRYRYATVSSLDLVSDLANALVAVMAEQLGEQGVARMRAAPTTNRSAYEHYMQARQALGRNWDAPVAMILVRVSNDEELATASRHYRAALDLDPEFAAAWAGLALLNASYTGGIDEERVRDKLHVEAKAQAEKALQLDPCAADALLALSFPWVRTERFIEAVFDATEQREMERLIRKAVECEPGNLEAQQRLTGFLLNFQFREQVQVASDEVPRVVAREYELDPTNCLTVERYLMTWGDFGTRAEPGVDMYPVAQPLTREATHEALRTIMVIDSTCGYDLIHGLHFGAGRLAEVIAWSLQNWEGNPSQRAHAAGQLADAYQELGLLSQAGVWACRQQRLEQHAAADDDCAERRPPTELAEQMEGNFTRALQRAEASIAAARAAPAADPVARKRNFVHAIRYAMEARRDDLVKAWLAEALQSQGSADPAALLFWNAKRTLWGRWLALDLAAACRIAGREADALRLATIGRRVPDPRDPEVFTGPMDQFLYLDARYFIETGDKAGAMRLLRRAVEQHQVHGGFYPSRSDLLTAAALEPLRQDPQYAPALQQLLGMHDAWLAPAREKVLAAEATGDWQALRTM